MGKTNPSLWGIKNLSNDTWKLTIPDGTIKEIAPQGTVPIGKGISIEFNGASGAVGITLPARFRLTRFRGAI